MLPYYSILGSKKKYFDLVAMMANEDNTTLKPPSSTGLCLKATPKVLLGQHQEVHLEEENKIH